jgi:peptidoglycan/LPS O-acetylase OafA/YrhL
MSSQAPSLNSPPITKTRLIHLDLLRGIAILLVLGSHLPKDAPDMSPFLKLWHRGGWCGVDLFFVLSGFLIGGLLFDEFVETGSIHLKRFFIRRGFKIWPSYILFVLFEFVCLLSEKPGDFTHRMTQVLQDMWPNFLHIQNYFPTPFIHTWSLAVEEHFYLLLPLLLLFMMKRAQSASVPNPFRHFPTIFACVAIVCLIARILTARLIHPFDLYTHVFPTHLRMDSLLTGVFLAYLVRFHHNPISRLRPWQPAIFLIAIALFLPPFLFDLPTTPWMYTLGPATLALGSAAFVLLAFFASQRNPRSKNPIIRFMSWIGIYSYSIYVWHLHISRSISHQLPARISTTTIAPITSAYVLLAIVVGAIMYLLIEYPTLAFRNRLFPRTGSPSPQPVPI